MSRTPRIARALLYSVVSLITLRTANSQQEETATPLRIVELKDLLRPTWNFNGYGSASVAGSGNRLYILLEPRPGHSDPPLLVILNEDGTTQRVLSLPPRVDQNIGIDANGTITILVTPDKKRPSLLKYSTDGDQLGSTDIGGDATILATYRQSVSKTRRGAFSMGIGTVSSRAEAITNVVPTVGGAYVDVSLSGGRTARLHLVRGAVILRDVAGNTLATHSIDSNVLGKFGKPMISDQPNVVYPVLYSPALSSGGALWALVAGTKLTSGAVAVKLDPESAKVDAILHFPLPKCPTCKNSDNLDGILVPTTLAICDTYAMIADVGSGSIAIYKWQLKE